MALRTIVRFLLAAGSAAFLTACTTPDPIGPAAGTTATPGTPANPGVTRNVITRAFIWSPESGFEVIPVPSHATSMNATAMNDAGQVVGYATLGEGTENYRAFIWAAETGYRPLGSLVGPDGISLAFTISESGEVTGVSEGPKTIWNGPMGIRLEDGFVWTEKSGMKAMETTSGSPDLRPVSQGGKLILPTATDCLSVVRSNDNGQAIGYAGSMQVDASTTSRDASPQCKHRLALLWESNGIPVAIAQCGSEPWCGTTLTDLNNKGEVVGNRDGGFRWTASGGLVPVPMKNAGLYSINDNGDVAGAVFKGNLSTPFVWMSSREIKVIQMPAGSTYGYPAGINERGQITGNFQ